MIFVVHVAGLSIVDCSQMSLEDAWQWFLFELFGCPHLQEGGGRGARENLSVQRPNAGTCIFEFFVNNEPERSSAHVVEEANAARRYIFDGYTLYVHRVGSILLLISGGSNVYMEEQGQRE